MTAPQNGKPLVSEVGVAVKCDGTQPHKAYALGHLLGVRERGARRTTLDPGFLRFAEADRVIRSTWADPDAAHHESAAAAELDRAYALGSLTHHPGHTLTWDFAMTRPIRARSTPTSPA